MPSVLIVDDLVSIHEMLEAVIQPTGFATSFATDGEKALVRYKAERYDLVLADIDMKPMDGITLLKQLKAYDPSAVVIMMTAYGTTDTAVQALKFGAFDYLLKPFRVDELIGTLRRGIESKKVHSDRPAAAQGPSVKAADIEAQLIGRSPKLSKLIAQVRKLATVRAPVLLVGENGTGKKTVAEILHGASGAPESALLRIDCSLSSEANFREGLLGQNGEGGSWVKKAKGGTLFLQHLQCLSRSVQQELVGVLRNTAHGFRLVCTSTADLEKLVDEGKFHDELFYRVASLPVQMPPLRERSEDIPLLVKHYVSAAANPAFDVKTIEFGQEALAVMMAHQWPGNLTELAQVVTHIAAHTESRVISAKQLPMRLREPKHWPTLDEHLAGEEKHYIATVLHATRNDKAAAAKVLGIDVSALG